MAPKNNGNFEQAKSTYLTELIKRANEAGTAEIKLLLQDLNFDFRGIREGKGSERKLSWTLIETGKRKNNIQDDTAVLRFANLDAENEYPDNPFLGQSVETLFEFL